MCEKYTFIVSDFFPKPDTKLRVYRYNEVYYVSSCSFAIALGYARKAPIQLKIPAPDFIKDSKLHFAIPFDNVKAVLQSLKRFSAEEIDKMTNELLNGDFEKVTTKMISGSYLDKIRDIVREEIRSKALDDYLESEEFQQRKRQKTDEILAEYRLQLLQELEKHKDDIIKRL